MNIRKMSSTFAATLGIGFGLCIATSIARADDHADPGQLTAQWWQWAFSIPLSLNPIADSTGGSCMIGQSGSLWFLTGNFGGSTVRACSVPEGTTLFFPVINQVGFNSPGCGQGPDNIPAKVLRKAVGDYIDSVRLGDLNVTLDNQPVYPFKRIQSDVFALAMPANNLGGCDPGVYSPAVDDGYYVKLDPLKVGPHTLHIHAAAPGPDPSHPFIVDVTYSLKIVNVLQK
jgi:hypothetical protein